MHYPRARTGQLAVEPVGDELVVYDERTQIAHSLSADASAVWTVCDGTRDRTQLASACGLEIEVVDRALEQLDASALLDQAAPALGLNRRAAIKHVGRVGGAALGASMIYSVAVPSARASASSCFPHVGDGCLIRYTSTNGSCTGTATPVIPCGSSGCACVRLNCLPNGGGDFLQGNCQ